MSNQLINNARCRSQTFAPQPDTELQAKQDVSQVHDEGCWLRDEEATGSSPATPTNSATTTAIGSLPRRSFASRLFKRCPLFKLEAQNWIDWQLVIRHLDEAGV